MMKEAIEKGLSADIIDFMKKTMAVSNPKEKS
jgi:hypothetical protein